VALVRSNYGLCLQFTPLILGFLKKVEFRWALLWLAVSVPLHTRGSAVLASIEESQWI